MHLKDGWYAIIPSAWVARLTLKTKKMGGTLFYPKQAIAASQQYEKFPPRRGWSLAQADNWKLTTLQSSEMYSPSQFPFENSDYKLSKSLNLYSGQEFSDSLNPNQLTYFNNVESEIYIAISFHLKTIIWCYIEIKYITLLGKIRLKLKSDIYYFTYFEIPSFLVFYIKIRILNILI